VLHECVAGILAETVDEVEHPSGRPASSKMPAQRDADRE
jgi:hypothetical protein